MQPQFLLYMLLLSAAALATPHEQDDTHSGGTESDLGEAFQSVDALLTDIFKISSLPGEPRTADIQSKESAAIQALSSLHVQALTLTEQKASKDMAKKTGVETTVGSLSTQYSAEPSKPTPKLMRSSPSNPKIAMTLTPTITPILPTAIGGNVSTISASSAISTKSPTNKTKTATSKSSQNTTGATSSSTPNVDVVQPTGTPKAAGALAIGVAGIMILL